MANAQLDQNSRPTLIGVLNTDPTQIVRVKANPTTHALIVSDATTGTDNGNNGGNALLDENHRPVMLVVSSRTATVNGVNYIAGVTPVEVYVDSNGSILITSA